MFTRALLFAVLAMVLVHPAVAHAAELHPGLAFALDHARSGDTFTAWVFLANRGLGADEERDAIAAAERELGERVRARRLVRGSGTIASVRDLPVAPRYLEAIAATGARVRARSRWLNAVSIEAGADAIRAVASLGFVRELRPVWTAPAESRRLSPSARRVDPHAATTGREPLRPPAPGSPATLDYGLSFGQLQQIQVPALHQMGLDGTGVRVGMLDTGFRLTHEADAPVNVLAQYDFIQRDSVTANQPGDDTWQDTHGTLTLSLIGGYKPGIMIGPAYNAEYVLAKTEMLVWERPVEEDWWVEGIEWLESWGVDVVSSSLGYFNFDNPYPDYHYADMNGDVAVTTIAADIAVSLGVVVANCLGNAGDDVGYTKMIAPADGDSVLGIGAVGASGAVTAYSSRGPTFDGRIKPDLCARGDVDVCADAVSGGYIAETGTSCSTPLVAGVCALLLQAHPAWTPMELAAKLKQTASRSAHPDTLFGWGIVRPYDLILSTGIGEDATGGPPARPALGITIRPNPSRGDAAVVISRATGSGTGSTETGDRETATMRVYDLTGRECAAHTVAFPRGSAAAVVDLVPLLSPGPPGLREGAARLAPGVYLVLVESGAGTASAKLLLLP